MVGLRRPGALHRSGPRARRNEFVADAVGRTARARARPRRQRRPLLPTGHSRPAPDRSSPSTPTTSSSTASTAISAEGGTADPAARPRPVRPVPGSAGGRASARRSSSGCGPTSSCASPSSTTSPSPTPCRSTRSSRSSPTSPHPSSSSSRTTTIRWWRACWPASARPVRRLRPPALEPVLAGRFTVPRRTCPRALARSTAPTRLRRSGHSQDTGCSTSPPAEPWRTSYRLTSLAPPR